MPIRWIYITPVRNLISSGLGYRVSYFVSLILILNIQAEAQPRLAYIPKDAHRDTTWWYAYQQQLCKKLHLTDVIHDSCRNHFRLWTDTRIVDVCRERCRTTSTLIRWTEEVVPHNEAPTGRIYKQVISAESAGLRIDTLIKDSRIEAIPDQSLIKGWQQGLDGTEYLIEYTTDSTYYFKTYWTPTAQENVKEALVVQHFVDSMLSIVESPQESRQFTASIPFECWTNGGISMGCKVLTKQQRRRYKFKRDKYRKNLKSFSFQR